MHAYRERAGNRKADVPWPTAVGTQVSKKTTFHVPVMVAYLVALCLGGDLSKGLQVLASLTCGLCGLAQHLVPNKLSPGWLIDLCSLWPESRLKVTSLIP